jgi:WD40 repeat protein
MRCPSCGKIIPDQIRYCPYCGTPVRPKRQGVLRWRLIMTVTSLVAMAIFGALRGLGISTLSPPTTPVISPKNAHRVTELTRLGKGVIHQVIWSPDGKQLAMFSSAGIYLYDAQTLREVQRIESSAGMLNIAFAPDGATFASGSGDGTIKIWEVASGRVLHTLRRHTDAVLSVAFAPDGATLASGSRDKTIKIWEVASGRVLYTLRGHTAAVWSVAFAPDGTMLASGSGDDTIKIWEVAGGRELHTLYGHTAAVLSVAFAPDGTTLASGSRDKTIKIWEVASGRELHTLYGHAAEVLSVAFAPDGTTLASGSADGTIRLWAVR